MHEVGIMQGALLTAEAQARERGAARIHRLRLRIGRLSGVVPDSLQFAFEALSPGTLAEGGTLEIENVPAVFWCRRCEREFEVADFIPECPHCHQWDGELRRGREMELSSMEIS
jgi:hydrogenase nickel incorporation protein HypA/HybF